MSSRCKRARPGNMTSAAAAFLAFVETIPPIGRIVGL
jgi:hypothetical protein